MTFHIQPTNLQFARSFTMKTHHLALLTLAIGAASAPLAEASLIFGLTGTNELVAFDSSSPGSVTLIGTISAAGIVDIDFSAANNTLYGANGTGQLFQINIGNALASLVATPLSNIANVTDIDFNPAADRVRVFSDGDRNFRLVPDASAITAPQAVAPAGTVINDGQFTNLAVNLVGSAYTNPFDNAATTTLYSIDTASNTLQIHSVGPAFSTVAAVGAGLGVDVGSNVGFDFDQNNVGFVSDGSNLYTVDTGTGQLSSIGTVGRSGLVSIAAAPAAVSAIPEPGSAMVGLGLLGVVFGSKLRRTRPARS